MVFIFIWFKFLTTSFPLDTELCFDVVIVRPAIPRGSCILTVTACPLESPLLLSSSLKHKDPLAILHFSLACRPSPLLLKSDILLWQSVSLFSPNPSFKNTPHPRNLSRMKMVPLKRASDEWENYCLLLTASLPCLTPESLFLGDILPASLYLFPNPLVYFQFLSTCF